MKKQDFKVLKTKDLYPFPDNPFHVAEDETLSELAESIKEFGIVTPIITRPKEDGDGYEVIAGQRRVRASELAGINTVPAFVLPLDRDRAIITLVDSNLQRENILPSERAFAYKMKSEAMKRQGFRTDLTSSQVVTKLRTDDKVAQGFGVGRMTVQRFIRLGRFFIHVYHSRNDVLPAHPVNEEVRRPLEVGRYLLWGLALEKLRAGGNQRVHKPSAVLAGAASGLLDAALNEMVVAAIRLDDVEIVLAPAGVNVRVAGVLLLFPFMVGFQRPRRVALVLLKSQNCVLCH